MIISEFKTNMKYEKGMDKYKSTYQYPCRFVNFAVEIKDDRNVESNQGNVEIDKGPNIGFGCMLCYDLLERWTVNDIFKPLIV